MYIPHLCIIQFTTVFHQQQQQKQRRQPSTTEKQESQQQQQQHHSTTEKQESQQQQQHFNRNNSTDQIPENDIAQKDSSTFELIHEEVYTGSKSDPIYLDRWQTSPTDHHSDSYKTSRQSGAMERHTRNEREVSPLDNPQQLNVLQSHEKYHNKLTPKSQNTETQLQNDPSGNLRHYDASNLDNRHNDASGFDNRRHTYDESETNKHRAPSVSPHQNQVQTRSE